MLRMILLGVSLVLTLISLVFTCVSVAGFSMNSDVVQNTYWSGANLPKLSIQGTTLDQFNLEYKYGLRLEVQLCDGNRCNDKGDDDIAKSESSYRIQSCDDYDDDSTGNERSVCFKCRNGGLAAGSLAIFALLFVTILIGMVGARFAADSAIMKFSSMGMAGAVLLFSFLAVAVYGGQCYQYRVDERFADDDVVDADDIDWYLGPGMIMLIVVMLFQPIVMVLLFFASSDNEGDGEKGGGGAMANQNQA